MDSEQTNLVLQRFAQAIVQRPRVGSKFPAGLLVVPEIRHRARSRSRSDRDRAAMARRKPGEAWNRGAGIPVIRSATSNASISVWGGPAMMYASPALPRSIARMCARAVSSTWAQQYAVRFGMARSLPWRYRTNVGRISLVSPGP